VDVQPAAVGSGELVISLAVTNKVPPRTVQGFVPSTGLGTIESVRGANHVSLDGVTLAGEVDIFGNPFSTAAWAKASAARTAWVDGKWMGVDWAGDGWTTTDGFKSWSGRAWSGRAWSGGAWSGRAWSGANWNGKVWSTLPK
jgi:serine protease AprX